MHNAKQSSLSKIQAGDTILAVPDGDKAFGFGRPKDTTSVPCVVKQITAERDQWSSKVYRVTLDDGRKSEGRYGTTHVYVAAIEARTDAEIDAALAEPATAEDQAVVESDRCHQCKGFGVVRKHGSQAGKAYRTLAGSESATANNNAEQCPVCKGAGLTIRAA